MYYRVLRLMVGRVIVKLGLKSTINIRAASPGWHSTVLLEVGMFFQLSRLVIHLERLTEINHEAVEGYMGGLDLPYNCLFLRRISDINETMSHLVLLITNIWWIFRSDHVDVIYKHGHSYGNAIYIFLVHGRVKANSFHLIHNLISCLSGESNSSSNTSIM